jgi:Arm DNA-binding domain/Phage integrase, N-terminal SAM-like domain
MGLMVSPVGFEPTTPRLKVSPDTDTERRVRKRAAPYPRKYAIYARNPKNIIALECTVSHIPCGHDADTGINAMAEQLTDKMVMNLPIPPSGNRITYDAEVRGLGVRVTSAGARAWVFNYRAGRTERRLTIGDTVAWTVKKVREEAKRLRRLVDGGDDPMADRHADRAAPTVNDLADRFVAEHLPKKRASTQDEYNRLLRVHIRPALGNKRVADLQYGDLEAMHRKIAATAPYAANRALAVTSKMLNLSIRGQMRTDNPAKGVERAQEEKRERFLVDSEIARLSEALAAHPERTSANAARFLLLTGARKGETLSPRGPRLTSRLACGPSRPRRPSRLRSIASPFRRRPCNCCQI